jgi:hypothetical protein
VTTMKATSIIVVPPVVLGNSTITRLCFDSWRA